MKILLFFIFVSVTLTKITAEVVVFSGTPNPVWEIDEKTFDILLSLAEKSDFLPTQRMGYKGFIVKTDSEYFTVHSNVKAEVLLLKTMSPSTTNAYQSVFDHCLERIMEKEVESSEKYFPREVSEKNHVYHVGPDNVTSFQPKLWNYYPVQEENNCYNYANYIRTDTFAQPGRGSGHKWTEDTCDSVGAAAVSDGLVKYTGDPPLGDKVPKDGHYVGLLIWPNTNFHWVRKDVSTYWSHKPGSETARDYDDNGKKITDPSKSDFSPWTQFCGYFVSVPSKETLD